MSNQFIRKVGLIVYGVGQTGTAPPSAPMVTTPTGTPLITVTPKSAAPGIDLSQFRIQFQVHAMDIDEPPTAIIRVMNLANSTVNKIRNEFQNVSLQAGYENGNYGVIFQGSIVRIRSGRVSNIDTFVDIMASNFDAVYNFGVISKSIAAGASPLAYANAVKQGVTDSPAAQGLHSALAAGMQYGNIPASFGTGGTLPRGKVLFGLAREHLQALADSQQCTWSVGPDGKVNFADLKGYLPGEAVVINAQTGMIGVPEATQNGIEVNTLLNPKIKCGTRIQLDNASINTTRNLGASPFPSYSGVPAFFASTSADGFYRVLVGEHEGDSRGHGGDWLTKITALAVDKSAAPSSSVKAYG